MLVTSANYLVYLHVMCFLIKVCLLSRKRPSSSHCLRLSDGEIHPAVQIPPNSNLLYTRSECISKFERLVYTSMDLIA